MTSHLDSYHIHCELVEVDQLELDWIRLRVGEKWNDNRTLKRYLSPLCIVCHLVQHQFECVAVRSNMPFLDIKDSTKRTSLVNEYVTVIGNELQTLFHPIVNTSKQSAEVTRKALALMRKALTYMDGALAQRVGPEAHSKPPLNMPGYDVTFGIEKKTKWSTSYGKQSSTYQRKDFDDKEYQLIPGLVGLIPQKHSRPPQYNDNDYKVYKSLDAQIKVKSSPNRAGTDRQHATSKWKHMPRRMVITVDVIEEGRRKNEEGRRKKDEGRRKKKEGRGKKEGERRRKKKEEGRKKK